MHGFNKKFIIFVYLFLSLFICSKNLFACENITQKIPENCLILSSKTKTALINNKEEKTYVILKTGSKSEITNRQNKNSCSNLFGSIKTKIFNTPNNFAENIIYPVYISYNARQNLENTIYTRAP